MELERWQDIDWVNVVPTKPKEDVVGWLRRQGEFDNEYIVYRAGWGYKAEYPYDEYGGKKERVVKCHCTACERDFEAPYVPYGDTGLKRANYAWYNEETCEGVRGDDTTICPYCGTGVRAAHISSISRNGLCVNGPIVMTVCNIKNHLALLCWNVERKIFKDGRDEISVYPWDAYIFGERKGIKLTAHKDYSVYYSWHYIQFDHWELRKRFSDGLGSLVDTQIYPFDSSVLTGTAAENCKLDVYILNTVDLIPMPVAYMRLWQRHKSIENLVMQGFSDFVTDLIQKGQGVIDCKKAKPHEMLNLAKDEYRQLRKLNLRYDEYRIYMQTKFCGVTPQNLRECIAVIGDYYITQYVRFCTNLIAAARYLKKQQKKYGNVDAGDLLDYWEMAEKLGDNLSDSDIMYPHNLTRAHDQVTAAYNLKKSKIRADEFKAINKRLSKFCFSADGLSIHPAKSPQEMRTEGKKLHHCVASYIDKVARGETAIFFIRHEDKPRTPYFTLEYDFKNMRVLQNRGNCNCARTPEVEAFEKQWVAFVEDIVAKENKKNKKRKKAA